MEEFIVNNTGVIIKSITMILVVLIGAIINSFFRIREINKQQAILVKEIKEKEKKEIRLQYVDPLRVAANDLSLMINKLIVEINNCEEKKSYLLESYRKIIKCEWPNKCEYYHQCNCGLYLAMSSLYVTVTYFSKAYLIRSKLPFLKSPNHADKTLLDYITDVRTSFGGEFGIWETIQDSLGQYITKEGSSIMTYKEFYEQLGHEESKICYQNLIKFYQYIDRKMDNEVKGILKSLNALIQYIESNFKIFEY